MRKNILYAPRVRGDLELGLEPSRATGPAGDSVKDWARMDFPGEHIPGMDEQGIYAVDDDQNYRIGTRRVQDERVFHYCKASANGCDKASVGAQNFFDYNTDETLGDCISGTTIGAKVTGEYTLVAADANALHVAGWFENGWCAVTVGSVFHMYRVRTSSVADAGNITITLWDALAMDVAEGSTIQVYPSIYGKVERLWAGGSNLRATVCVPPIVVPASNYFWGQTYGPCYGVAPEPFPKGTYENMMVFSYQGGLYLQGARSANNMHQIAGYRLFNYETDESGYLILFMLTLAP